MTKSMKDILNELDDRQLTPGEMARSIRRRLGLTQDEVAELSNIKRENISALENGRLDMSVRYAKVLAVVFGVSPVSILFPNGSFTKSKELLVIEKKAQIFLKKKKVG